MRRPAEPDLRHHGDAEVRDAADELTDLAVNVRTGTPPPWLRARIADSLATLAAYPDGRAARRAVAARHRTSERRVLLTSGAAEAFVLLARALPASRPVVVHPQFTEPEAALRDAGHRVERALLTPEDGFRLTPGRVPDHADLVLVGNPTNPTSVLHPREALVRLARPGRTLVVDEAFIDAVPGERESLAPLLSPTPTPAEPAEATGPVEASDPTGSTDPTGTGVETPLPGRVLVLRSLTKTWGLAGLRVGYVLSDPGTISLLAREQPLWPVSTPALSAAEACSEPTALLEAERAAATFAEDRAHLVARLAELPGVSVAGRPQAPFVLAHHSHAEQLRAGLRELGFAVRRGDTFPGLGPEWLRLAVRDRATTDGLATALDKLLG